MTFPRRFAALLAAGAALLVAGCSTIDDPSADAPSQAATPTVGSTASSTSTPTHSTTAGSLPVYVAVGASETVGVGADRPGTQAWPRVFHDTALPKTKFVNVGVSGSTVSDALIQQVPSAVAAKPAIVSVWLNVNDLVSGVPAAAYEAELRTLVRALRRDGNAQVLLANTPPVESLPAYLACLPSPPAGSRPCAAGLTLPDPSIVRAAVASYNAAIARVAKASGAVVVDLHAAAAGGAATTWTSSDGFHPNTAGHRAVAMAFAQTLRRAGSVG